MRDGSPTRNRPEGPNQVEFFYIYSTQTETRR